ncbi:MAG: hypothetical protein LBC43_00070 [Bifidobacteriaceae bacterium]|jgi:hypothetical protein|nr:hypothetical protein [Bifidobacteriaceae bacterium]
MSDNYSENSSSTPPPPIEVIYVSEEKNSFGTAGFILALAGLIFSWIPYLGWTCWVLGVVFSIIGLFKDPKGLAIAGLVISFIGIIVLMVIFAGLLGFLFVLV